MSAIIYNFNRDSFCATCLSQTGQLIAVRDSQARMLFYSELNLQLTNRVCPECHDFVQKMVAFKSRAQQAQAWLRNMATFQALTPSWNVMAPNAMPATTDPLTLDIKSEPENHQEIKVELKQNETSNRLNQNVYGSVQQHVCHTPGSVNSDTVMKSEIEDNTHGILHQNMARSYQLQPTHSRVPVAAVPSDSAMLIKPDTDANYDNGNDNTEALPLENKIPCRTLQQNHCADLALGLSMTAMPLMNPENECNGNDNVEAYENLHQNVIPCRNQIETNLGATATSKPSRIIKPEAVENRSDIGVADDVHKRNTNSVEVCVFTHQKVKPNKASAKNKSKTPATAQPDYIYTEKILTEGEMTQWRQMKSHTEFYARGVPSERCERCIEPFDYRLFMWAHAKLHTEACGELVCDICQQRTIDKPAMEVHKKWHYRLLKCRYCPFVWDNVNTMRHHCREMHNVPQVLWDCDRCERQLSSLQLWRRHTRNHRRAKCTVCGLTVNEGSLKPHMKTHTNGRTQIPLKKCEECGKQFRSVEGLRCHMRRHRGEIDEKAYCAECNKQFLDMHQYKNHMKYTVKHASSDIFRYTCDDCGREFAHKVFLRKHIETKHSTRRNYKCETCSATFKTTQARNKHRREKHEGFVPPRDKMCDHCGKGFQTKLLLAQHMNTHTGSRPYACTLCGADFGFKSALYLHKRYKHNVQKKSNSIKQ